MGDGVAHALRKWEVVHGVGQGELAEPPTLELKGLSVVGRDGRSVANRGGGRLIPMDRPEFGEDLVDEGLVVIRPAGVVIGGGG